MAEKLYDGIIDTFTMSANDVFQQLYAMMEAAEVPDDSVAGIRISFVDIDGTEKYLWIEMEAPDEWEASTQST